MVVKNKILVLPHVGTAYGHLIRTIEYISTKYSAEDDVTMVLPQHAIDYSLQMVPTFVKILIQKTSFSINNSSGELKLQLFLELMKELEGIVNKVKPNLIIGDPGVRASILSQKFNIRWIGLMHGCYLPKPNFKNHDINKSFENLMETAWKVTNMSLDILIKEATNGRFTKWEEIRNTGEIIIPNNSNYEPSSIGKFWGEKYIRKGWLQGTTVKTLITFCSEGDVKKIGNWEKMFGIKEEINIAGLGLGSSIGNIKYIGNNTCYESLVNEHTTVVTHGGHGTLKSIENAKRVFMMPTDIDQLCNSMIAHLYRGWDIVFDKNWFEILESNIPYKRNINWDNITISKVGSEIVIAGLDLQVLHSQYRENVELV